MSNSKRFCVSCEKVTTWKYNPVLSHSRCSECAGRYSFNPDNVEQPNANDKIVVLEAQIKVLQKKCKDQRDMITNLLKKNEELRKSG